MPKRGAPDLRRRTAHGPAAALREGRHPAAEIYRSVVSREPVARAGFHLYLDGNTLVWVKEPCRPEDTRRRSPLHVFPADFDGLAEDREKDVFNAMNFYFHFYGLPFEGKGMIARALPDYDTARLGVGQRIPGSEVLWPEEIPLPR